MMEHVKSAEPLTLEERLKNYDGPDAVVTSYDMLDLLAKDFQHQQEFSFESGIPRLDNLITGFYGGELSIVSGKTGHGKTLFCQTITNNLSLAGDKVLPLWFTYEVRIKQFCEQFGETVPSFLVPKTLKQNDMVWLEHRIFEGILKFGCKAFFIDNTHNILNLSGDNLVHRVDEFVKRLKEICVKFNVHGFLLHHMMKCEVNHVDSLDGNLLRDSSMIPQTADNVFFVWRDESGAWLTVDKNRRNGVWKKKVRIEKHGNFFRETAELDVTQFKPRRRPRADLD